MTALVAPPIAMQSALALSLRVAVAVQTAIVQIAGFTRPGQIDNRWPNDLMLTRKDGPARKCGGILIDTASNPARPTPAATLRYAIIGIGLNLNQTSFPPELDAIATSSGANSPNPPNPSAANRSQPPSSSHSMLKSVHSHVSIRKRPPATAPTRPSAAPGSKASASASNPATESPAILARRVPV